LKAGFTAVVSCKWNRGTNREGIACSDGESFVWGRELTHCLGSTVVDEGELRIPALNHSKFPSDAVGNGLPGAWDESEFGFHYFDLLNARAES